MKYYSTLPATALFAFTIIHLLVQWHIIPSGLEQLNLYQNALQDYFFLLIVLIIFLESIVYVGFYFPGQFFAVLLVIGAGPSFSDIVKLTFSMVAAATAGSMVNYAIGRFSATPAPQVRAKTKLKHLLLAMIHMNSLAFFMLAQGANRKPIKVVFLAGLLNLPYYLLIIAATVYLSDEVMQIAENTPLLFSLLSVWLAIALYLDFVKPKIRSSKPSERARVSQNIPTENILTEKD